MKDEPLERRLRIRDEVPLNSLAKVSFPNPWDWPVDSAHPLDLVIFEPLRENSPGSKDPFDCVNQKARVVIELKKDFANRAALDRDCRCLKALADAWLSPGSTRPAHSAGAARFFDGRRGCGRDTGSPSEVRAGHT